MNIISIVAKKLPQLANLVRRVYYYWLPEIDIDLQKSLQIAIERENGDGKPFYFVQVGAHDGSFDDPIAQMKNRYKQWRGILLEPQEFVFKRLAIALIEPERFRLINKALSEHDGEQTLFKIGFSQKSWATGLASFDRDSIARSIGNGYVTKMALASGDILPNDMNDYIVEDKVTTISFKSLIALFEKEPDCIIVDTEGYDFVIVNRLLDHNVNPVIWWFEYSYMNIHELEKLIKRLKRLKYSVKRSQWDIFAYLKSGK